MSEPAFRHDSPLTAVEATPTANASPPHDPSNLSPEAIATLAALFSGKGNSPWGKSHGRNRGTSLA
jgi:hypothetical protein